MRAARELTRAWRAARAWRTMASPAQQRVSPRRCDRRKGMKDGRGVKAQVGIEKCREVLGGLLRLARERQDTAGDQKRREVADLQGHAEKCDIRFVDVDHLGAQSLEVKAVHSKPVPMDRPRPQPPLELASSPLTMGSADAPGMEVAPSHSMRRLPSARHRAAIGVRAIGAGGGLESTKGRALNQGGEGGRNGRYRREVGGQE